MNDLTAYVAGTLRFCSETIQEQEPRFAEKIEAIVQEMMLESYLKDGDQPKGSDWEDVVWADKAN